MSTNPDLSDIQIIAFDADDTLWHCENMFQGVQEKLSRILDSYAPHEEVMSRLHATEMQNIHLFGYGVKGFTLSMVETAIEISRQRISAGDIHEIVMMGKGLLDAPLALFDDVNDVLAKLGRHYRLFLITKGDVMDQRNKIGKSGLEHLFERTIVVQEKDVATYSGVFEEHHLDIKKTAMVGNSLRSDILPILEMGGTAIHIPYHVIAHFEVVDDVPDQAGLLRADSLKSLIDIFPKG